jgi:hypothetical protein
MQQQTMIQTINFKYLSALCDLCAHLKQKANSALE